LLLRLRAGIFYIGFFSATFIYSSLCLLVCPFLSDKNKFVFCSKLPGFVIRWLKWTCGIGLHVSGIENIRPGIPYIIFVNHQSAFETLFVQTLFPHICTVLKKELLYIPFFGWSLRFLKPIAIDRQQRIKAFRQVVVEGKERLGKGISVLIFPEGTFYSPGAIGNFLTGGASLASITERPILPAVHNAGEHWISESWRKVPGTIEVVIGPEIPTAGLSTREIQKRAFCWMDENLKRISSETIGPTGK